MSSQRDLRPMRELKEFACEGDPCWRVEESPRDQLLGPHIKRLTTLQVKSDEALNLGNASRGKNSKDNRFMNISDLVNAG